MKCLLALAVQLQLWDGLITQVFAGNGLAQEGNPLMASMVRDGSFLVFKIAGVLLSAALLWFVYRRFPRLATATTIGVVALYCPVIAWNFLTIFSV